MCKDNDSDDELNVFPEEAFPEDAFPSDVFPPEIFPRPLKSEDEE